MRVFLETQFSERLQYTIPAPEMAWKSLRFYEENRSHLKPWEPSKGPEFYSEEYHRYLMAGHLKAQRAGTAVRYWISERGSDRWVGAVNFTSIALEPQWSCTVGYKMDERHTGKGYMTEALGFLCGLLLEHRRLHRIEAAVMPRNEASRRVLEKNGFSEEGLAKGYLRVNGEWEDHSRYARLSLE